VKKIKSHFWYNKRQRNGIFFLLIIIVSLQSLFFFVDFSSDEINDIDTTEFLIFQKELDSLTENENKTKSKKLYPFNPNFITDYKGYQLGMSVEEIDRLHSFRSKGAYVNSKKEFQKVTQINDSLLKEISPFFKFPSWVNANNGKEKKYKRSEEIPLNKKNINLASANEFTSIKGIGEKLAKRIVDYRKKLQGFSFNEQLYEVWGLDKEIADMVLQYYKVAEPTTIKKLNINNATFKEVLAIVYIDYDLAKKIFNYRDEVAEIQEIEELKKIEGFPMDKFSRITLYLEAK